MNASENENSHKKKLIVPIIAIMLCAVAVIGVGYAYTSDVHVNGNTLNGGDLQIDYTANSEGGKTHAIFYSSDSSIDVTFVTDRTYDAGPDGSITGPTTTVEFGGSSSDSKSSYIGTMVVTITSSQYTTGTASMSIKVDAPENVSGSIGDIHVGSTYVLSDIVESITVVAKQGGTDLGTQIFDIAHMGSGDPMKFEERSITDINPDSGATVSFEMTLNLKDSSPKALSGNDTISSIISAFESIKFNVTASVEGVAS
ncbi:hypothetical protein [Methanomethylophilus alvi]|uniref:Uncharacterized protein n=1 Tax=Methanomethylophilus alvi TaxID=1291540 RepID=A0A3G3IFZ2_9ARCH|nr:hypothetical protein [Methanomethylophilus alvi]AYQ54786.1 hypothetical protein BKD89_03055 [Methanomethylophilus alvi]